MTSEESLRDIKDGVSIVSEIIKAAGGHPNVKEAAGNLGQSAVTITKTINNALLPLAAINFAFEKARIYFSHKFQEDILEKAAAIPMKNIIEPKASIAGPTLQGLAFTHEELNLKEMYLNLLATAMDDRVASTAHPAFVEIIKQLDSDDARLVREVLQVNSVPIVQIQSEVNSGGYTVVLRHLINLKELPSNSPKEDLRLPAMIDNWVRLGLVDVTYSTYLNDPNSYSWVEQRPEFLRFSRMLNSETQTVGSKKGIMERTELGKMFAIAVGLAVQ